MTTIGKLSILVFGLLIYALLTGFSGEPALADNPSKSLEIHPDFSDLPGTQGLNMKLAELYSQMKQTRGESYHPRTKHLRPDGWALYTNRLFLESSPYLLQHAHNPVDWYPWGQEAFQTATALKRPILLSVGYSTCHWCHVMEEESFEDEEIARYINENYIAIKVDREERPDIDAIYMAAVQALTGRGGWPMTVWLTPEGKPFYGGTYYPARDGDRGAGVGFLTLLKKIRQSYDERQDLVARTSQQLTDVVKSMLAPAAKGEIPGADIMQDTFRSYQRSFDWTHGGISGAPKFPSSLPIRFLLRFYTRFNQTKALDMATLTLDKMAASGLHDHIGGGFHRYATDERWLVPHFEKMLYDNALLVMDYLDGYQVTGKEHFRHVLENVLQYVQRDMTSPQGAFYSATDADSLTPEGHREEGYYFTWTPQEIDTRLGKELGDFFKTTHGIGPTPNFEGRYIPHMPTDISTLATQLNLKEKDLRQQISKVQEILRQERNLRPLPLRDEKILTAWNGLMISAFAKAGFVLQRTDFIESAIRSANFILEHLYVDGRLMRSYNDGRPKHNAYLDDYAFLTAGLLDLYETTFNRHWLEQVIRLEENLATRYEDKMNGGFFMTSSDHESMIAREKPNHDGALPSGNAVATMNLLRLGALTTNADYIDRAQKALMAFAGILASNPTAMAELQLALDFYLNPPKEIIIVKPSEDDDSSLPMMDKVRKRYLPGRVLTVVREGQDLEQQSKLIPLLKRKTVLNARTTAYVCQGKTCLAPTNDPDVFAKQLADTTSDFSGF